MPLWLALICILACAIPLRGWRISMTAALLLGNWSVNTWIAHVSGTQYNWAAMASIDFTTATLLLSTDIKRWQIIIVGIYAYELVAHAARAWVGVSAWSDYYYWYSLHYGAWAQLWVVITWGGYDLGKRLWGRIGDKRRAPVVALVDRFMGSSARPGERK
jgi:hypothetical protein